MKSTTTPTTTAIIIFIRLSFQSIADYNLEELPSKREDICFMFYVFSSTPYS